MADVIRDAVVRLGIEQKNVVLKAPDIRPVNAAIRSVADSQKNLAKASKSASVAMIDGMSRAAEATNKHIEGVKKWEAGLKKIRQQREAADRSIADAQKKAAEAVVKSQAGVTASLKQVAGAAGGVAVAFGLIGAATAEGLDPAIRASLALAGAGKLVQSGIATYEALNAVQSAMAVRATAAAAANTVNAGAIAASGVAAAVATPPMIAFSAAAAPVLLILAAVAGAVAVAGQAWRAYSGDIDKATEAQERSKRGLERHRAAMAGREQRLKGDRSEAKRLTISESSLAKQFASLGEEADRRFGGKENEGPFADTFNKGKAEGALSLRIKQAEIGEQLINIAKKNLSVAKAANSERIKAIQHQDALVRGAKEALAAEKGRVRSIRASIGALDDSQASRLDSLINKKKRGEKFNRSEAIEWQQLTGAAGGTIGSDRLSELGRARTDEVTLISGVDASDTQTKDFQRVLEKHTEALNHIAEDGNVSEVLAKLKQENEEVTAVALEGLEKIETVFGNVVDLVRRLDERLDDLDAAAR